VKFLWKIVFAVKYLRTIKNGSGFTRPLYVQKNETRYWGCCVPFSIVLGYQKRNRVPLFASKNLFPSFNRLSV